MATPLVRYLTPSVLLPLSFSLHALQPGALDTGFNPGSGANGMVISLASQSDNKLLLAGTFSSVNGVSRTAIARLNSNGSVDATFNPNLNPADSPVVSAIGLQQNGKILIGDMFYSINGNATYQRLARLNTDGTADASFQSPFNPLSGNDDRVLALVPLADGKILMGGNLYGVSNPPRSYLVRLNTNGSVDTSFVQPTVSVVETITVQPDGKIVTTGWSGIKRFNASGTTDTGFASPISGYEVALQANGKLLVSGDTSIRRLHANGSLDTTFNIGFYPGKIVVQADGKFITVGAKVARFNPDGSLDSGFIQGPAANKVAMQSDGRLVVSGSFTSYNGTAQNGIARISTGDTDNDGLEDGTDTDTDNDGHLNGADAFVWNAAEWLDTDHDGVGNNADTDDDGDRVPDVLDADPLNPLVDAMPLNGAYKGSALRAAQAAQ